VVASNLRRIPQLVVLAFLCETENAAVFDRSIKFSVLVTTVCAEVLAII